jgi:hypothetical protein
MASLSFFTIQLVLISYRPPPRGGLWWGSNNS